MSILANCPGGFLLEPPEAVVTDTDLRPFADELVSGLTRATERRVPSPGTLPDACGWASFREDAPEPCSVDRLGSTEIRQPQLVLGPDLQSSQVDCMATAQGHGAS